MTQREAYRQAGGKSKSDETADAVVCEMLKNPKAKAYYEALMSEAAAKAIMSRERALAILADIAEGVKVESKPSERVQALKQMASMQGWEAPKVTELDLDVVKSGEPCIEVELVQAVNKYSGENDND